MKKDIENMLMNIALIIGILCLSYFVMYALFVDLTNVFTYFWLALGMVLVLVKPIGTWMEVQEIVMPIVMQKVLGAVIVIGLLIFVVTECVIVGYGNKQPTSGADYVLILGAQVKGTRLTYALQTRLDAAYEYAKDNPNSYIIVSGGQGMGESVTEAYAMAEYLKSKGLAEERLILEDKSKSTYENIAYSKELMDSMDANVVLVTNHFHVYRGVGVAKKQGLSNVEGLGSSTKWYTIPNQYVREAFAVLKYKLCGQI